MRLRKLLLSMMISSVSLGSAAAQQPIKDPARATTTPASRSAKRISDDSVPAVATSGGQNHYQRVQYEMPNGSIAPAAMSYSPGCDMSGCDMASCGVESSCGVEAGCDGNCGGGCGSGFGSFSGNRCGGNGAWFGAESLLWWGQNRNAPPLMTTAAQGVVPIAGAPGVTTVAGGVEGLNSGLLPGYRITGGMYFGPEQRVGISGRVFGIFRQNDTISRTSDGSTDSLGLPFFNALINQPDAYLVGFNNGAPVSSGTASVSNRIQLVAAEPSLRFLVSRSCDHHVDLLGGYTYLNLKDSVTVASDSIDTFTGNFIPDGTRFQTNDLFAAENTFHGGHLGLQSTVARSRVSLTTLTKVSFGNMHETTAINGSTIVTQPNGAPQTTAGGIYAQASNSGPFTRDTFAFIPELGIRSGLKIRDNMKLTAGYTFLFVSKAALAGNQINPVLDPSQFQGGAQAVQPTFDFREGSMWFQGLDLGLNWTF